MTERESPLSYSDLSVSRPAARFWVLETGLVFVGSNPELRCNVRRSPVRAQLRERHRTRHERSAPARDLATPLILEHALGEIQSLRARHDAPSPHDLAFAHRTR